MVSLHAMKKAFAALFALALSASGATAQTQPAQMGVTPGGRGPFTIYSTHAGLVANTTRPSGPYTLYQQRFSAAGKGGAATYEWDAASYCPDGTSSTPTPADGVVCVLPIGQTATTAGRFRLQVPGGRLDVQTIGMAPGGQDNAPLIPTLMKALGPNGGQGGYDIIFSGIFGQPWTSYYFSAPLVLSRGMHLYCPGGTTADNSVVLAFAPGVDGIIQEDVAFSPPGAPGGYGVGTVEGCELTNLGYGRGTTAPGATAITGISFATSLSNLPPPTFHNGDALFAFSTAAWGGPPVGQLVLAPGAYINASGGTLTLQGGYTVHPQFGSAHALFTQGAGNFVAGEKITLGNGTYHFVTPVVGSTPGNVLVGPNWITSITNLANCINSNTTNTTCVAQSSTPNVTADQIYSNGEYFWSTTGGTSGNSLTATYSGSSATGGSFGGFVSGAATRTIDFWDLPASQAYTVQTTLGSPYVLVVMGPRPLEPGDIVWSKAFPIWTSVAYARQAVQFTETSSRNFVAGDRIQAGNNTYTFVSRIGSTPGNVLRGANFAASAANLAAAINRTAGSGSTYIATVAARNITATVGATTINFSTTTGGLAGAANPSVYTASGTAAGSFDHATFVDQMLLMDQPYLNAIGQNALETEAAGTLWEVPALLKRHVTASSTRMSFRAGAIGLEMPCGSHTDPLFNCDFSSDSENTYQTDGIARFSSGSNYSGSGSINEFAADNFYADNAELGALGSSYFNFNSHSAESGTSFANVIKNCNSQNLAVYYGGYFGGDQYPSCAKPVGLLPFTNVSSGSLMIGPQNLVTIGSPYIAEGSLGGGVGPLPVGQTGRIASPCRAPIAPIRTRYDTHSPFPTEVVQLARHGG